MRNMYLKKSFPLFRKLYRLALEKRDSNWSKLHLQIRNLPRPNDINFNQMIFYENTERETQQNKLK